MSLWLCWQLAFGSSHAVAVTKDGQLYAWGKNDFGQIGAPPR
jgi:alpha-tubulin suppressor-like RCC1 family protein